MFENNNQKTQFGTWLLILRQRGVCSWLSRQKKTKTSRTPEYIYRVREINENPETSTRKRATQLGMARSSLRRILKKDLLPFPYKFQMVHEMSPQEQAKNLQPDCSYL